MDYTIIRDIAVISDNGYETTELKYMQWGKNNPKYDLRKWKDSNPLKGVTMDEKEAKSLMRVLTHEFNMDIAQENSTPIVTAAVNNANVIGASNRKYGEMTNLEKVRRNVGMTQVELEEKSGISYKTIREYEQGRSNINNARVCIVVALADALGVRVTDIMN